MHCAVGEVMVLTVLLLLLMMMMMRGARWTRKLQLPMADALRFLVRCWCWC
jgi:hypothetical protein